MPKGPSAGDFNRKLRAAQRSAQRRADTAARRNNRDLGRQVSKAIKDGNRDAERRTRRLQRSSPSPAQFDDAERELLDQFEASLAGEPDEARDLFLSYTRSDGAEVARVLYGTLTELGASVWYDEVAMRPGKSQALQMDRGLTQARAGVVLLTPAFLQGRFWPERELGVLLSKPTVIPVLHGVTFRDVAAYSGFLQDMAGFTTDKNTPTEIAELIAAAVLDESDESDESDA